MSRWKWLSVHIRRLQLLLPKFMEVWRRARLWRKCGWAGVSSSRLRCGRVHMRQRLHTIGIRLWRRLGLLRRQRRGHLPSTVNSIWWIEAQHNRNARAPPSARLLAPTIPSCVLINYHRFLILRLNFHPVSYHLETIVMRISFIYFVVFFYRQGVVFNFYRRNNLFLVYTD